MCLRPLYATLCALAAALGATLAGAAEPSLKLRLINGDEAPPARYLQGPTPTGRTVERAFDSRKALHAFCSRHLGEPQQGRFYACYIPAIDLVAVPSPKAWPDEAQREALRAHEWAHARGWRHPLRLARAGADRGAPTAAVR